MKGPCGKHGNDAVFRAGEGTDRYCVTLLNTGYGRNTSLGCRTLEVASDRLVPASAREGAG
jgi:hypothetical protein